MPDPVIIALSGKKGAGKNTVSSFIRDYFSRVYYKGSRNGISFCIEVAFADLLKQFCIDVLGLERSQCYGSDDEKNTPTKYKWADVAPQCNGFMTGREVMQIFGTESVRAWFGNVWADATIRKIVKELPALAIITDNRFPSEVEAVLGQPNGYTIRLTRSLPGNDKHSSEVALDDFNWDIPKCFVLDNEKLSISEQNNMIVPILDQIFLECANELY